MKSDAQGGMGSTPELTISNITGSVTKDSPDVYITFRLGDEHAETPVIKNAGDTLHWTEPVTVAAGELGGRSQSMKTTGPQLIVRAYDKKPLMPDSLLGEAKVALSELSLGDSHVAGSGGGQSVQVQLLGKKDDFGGELRFTVTSTEGLSVPGGTTWGPQEVHDKQGAGMVAGGAAAGAGMGASSGQSMSPKAGDHGTTGFQGGGATAFPAQDSGKLTGEHLSDFGKGGAGAGGLTAEHSGDHGTAGFGGGGATAFPAQASGKDLKGEHLSDFDKSKAAEAGAVGGLAAGAAGAAAAASRDCPDSEAGFAGESASDQQGGESLVDKLKNTLGLGGGTAAATGQPSEQSTMDTIKNTLGFGGGDAATSERSAEQMPKEQGTGGATTGVAGGGAEARPAEASGHDLGGERLADFEQDRRSDVATAPGAAPTAAFAAAGSAATIGALAAAQGNDNTDIGTGAGAGTGIGGIGSSTGGTGAESTMATAGSFNDNQSEEQRKGALFLAAGAAGVTHEGGLDSATAPGGGGGVTGGGVVPGSTGGGGPTTGEQMTSGATALGTSAAGGIAGAGLAADSGDRGVATGYASDPTQTDAASRGAETGITTSYTPGSTETGGPEPGTLAVGGAAPGTRSAGGPEPGTLSPGGPVPGTTVSAKDLATDSVKREWAAQENAPLAGDTVADAQRTPAPLAGGGDVGDDQVLRISGISGKMAREEDFLGHVTPYLVFEVGKDREATGTLKKGVRTGEELNWEDNLELELGDGAADQELHIIAYDKKHLLPDSRLGDAVALLSQLPRNRPARLNLLHERTRGNIAGHVDFTLTGGGPGGEGAGNDVGFVEGAPTLNVVEHDAVGRGEKLPLDQRKPGVLTPEDKRRADAEDGGAQEGVTE